jgi:hypothetical protein
MAIYCIRDFTARQDIKSLPVNTPPSSDSFQAALFIELDFQRHQHNVHRKA